MSETDRRINDAAIAVSKAVSAPNFFGTNMPAKQKYQQFNELVILMK